MANMGIICIWLTGKEIPLLRLAKPLDAGKPVQITRSTVLVVDVAFWVFDMSANCIKGLHITQLMIAYLNRTLVVWVVMLTYFCSVELHCINIDVDSVAQWR